MIEEQTDCRRCMRMKVLFFIALSFIVYGSLFPFTIDMPLAHGASISAFLTSWKLVSSRGDALSNIALFLPFGFLGIRAFVTGKVRGSQIMVVLLLAALTGVSLQFLQIYIASRTPNLGDAFWNFFGAALGAASAALVPQSLRGFRLDRLPAHSVIPMALLGIWIAWRLFPYIPSLDLQLFKDSLKPLLLHPELSAVDMIRDASGWLAVFSLAAAAVPGRRSEIAVSCAIPVIFSLEVIIIRNSVTASDVAGALSATAVWRLLLIRFDGQKTCVAALLMLAILLQAVSPLPLERRHEPAAFGWVPFAGLLSGSSAMNAQALLGKSFFYTASLWLLKTSGHGVVAPAMLLGTLLAGLAMVQVHFGSRTPEITDLVLLAGIVAAMGALDSERSALPRRLSR